MGEGVKVVVIDDGCYYKHNDLNNTIDLENSFNVSENNKILDGGNSNHGTASAGLLGANGANCNAVYGVAPKCDLIILKAGDNEIFNPSFINNALAKAYSLNAKIVSLSLSFSQDFQQIRNWVTKCINDKDIIIVASAGDKGDSTKNYPASYPCCFSVGAYFLENSQRQIYKEHSNHNEFVSLIAPGKDLKTTGPDCIPVFHQATSASAAFIAGTLTLVVAALKSKVINYKSIVTAPYLW